MKKECSPTLFLPLENYGTQHFLGLLQVQPHLTACILTGVILPPRAENWFFWGEYLYNTYIYGINFSGGEGLGIHV